MSLISLVGAAKDFGIRTLFSDLDLHIGERERLGLIGPNGAGKSTLLRVLAGSEPLGEGERRCSPRLRVVLVSQDSRITPGLTVLEQVLEGCGAKRDLLVRFSALSEAIAEHPDDETLLAELGQLSQRMDDEEAWSLGSSAAKFSRGSESATCNARGGPLRWVSKAGQPGVGTGRMSGCAASG